MHVLLLLKRELLKVGRSADGGVRRQDEPPRWVVARNRYANDCSTSH